MKNKLIIIALFGIFLLPPILSWVIYTFGDVEGGKRNNGNLIQPPRTLPELSLKDVVTGEKKPLYGKWSLVFFHQGACEDVCKDKLYKARQIRLAMNKYAHRLQRAFIIEEEGEQLLNEIKSDYEGQLLLNTSELGDDGINAFQLNDEQTPFAADYIYVVDPIGNVMMYYTSEDDPLGIIEDLLLLIKISRIG